VADDCEVGPKPSRPTRATIGRRGARPAATTVAYGAPHAAPHTKIECAQFGMCECLSALHLSAMLFP